MPASQLETVFLQGSNQFKSQYRISFPGGLPAGVTAPPDPNLLILRMDKAFEIPKRQDYTFQRYYQGLRIEETGPKDETEKVIKLDLRLDAPWATYNTFRSWKSLCFDDMEGSIGDEVAVRGNIRFEALQVVNAPGIPKPVAKTFDFKYCKPKNINITEWNHEEGDPARIDLELIYVFIIES